jgi:hypothetical protein
MSLTYGPVKLSPGCAVAANSEGSGKDEVRVIPRDVRPPWMSLISEAMPAKSKVDVSWPWKVFRNPSMAAAMHRSSAMGSV